MKRPIPIYPFLFAAFPVLNLFSRNMAEYPLSVTYGLLATVLGATFVGLLGLAAISRSVQKSAILFAIFLFFFVSFRDLLGLLPAWDFYIAQRSIMEYVIALFAMVVCFTAAYLLFMTRKNLEHLTRILNLTAIVLIVVPLFKITVYTVKTSRVRNNNLATYEPTVPIEGGIPNPTPHIFYIVLDGYGRSDTLREIYNFDNSEFITFLKDRGFYVAEKSRSNYSHTHLSLASSLNMDYLDGLSARLPEDFNNIKLTRKMIQHSKSRTLLEKIGYKFASVSTGFYSSEIRDADIYIIDDIGQIDEFNRGFWNYTPLKTKHDKSEMDRRRLLLSFDALPKLAKANRPLFVFAHILAPHPPFVFSRDGKPSDINKSYLGGSANHLIKKNGMTRSEYMRRFIDQLVFINNKVAEAVSGILENSDLDPIIIIQGDHGPGTFTYHEDLEKTYLKDRMSILNAYHFPGAGNELLNSKTTPVNSFRIVFNHFFRLNFPLLADRSYFSQVKNPYQFHEVTDEIGDPEDTERYERLRALQYTPETL